MNWEKLKSIHYHEDPVAYIYSHALVESKEYDNLYENQNDLTHQVWQEFDAKYKTGFEFKSDFVIRVDLSNFSNSFATI